MTRRTTVLLLAAALAGCGAKNQTKRYAMDGVVTYLDPATERAYIAAGKIGDWMEAMTMPYPVRPTADYRKLHVGDHLQATVVVANDGNYYVTEVKILPATPSPK
jgi:Cu/Ag efflux protein CusF